MVSVLTLTACQVPSEEQGSGAANLTSKESTQESAVSPCPSDMKHLTATNTPALCIDRTWNDDTYQQIPIRQGTYSNAVNYCDSKNARVCSYAEVEKNCAEGYMPGGKVWSTDSVGIYKKVLNNCGYYGNANQADTFGYLCCKDPSGE